MATTQSNILQSEKHPDKENYLPNPKVQDAKMQPVTYISPSDTIMSPATQKLAAFKTKHMGKGLKSKTLFAKTVTNQANNSGVRPPQSMFGDIPKQQK